jgi:nitrate ABC transporter ATP-binding subunit
METLMDPLTETMNMVTSYAKNETAIEVKDLVVSFPSRDKKGKDSTFTAVKDITFDVKKGEIISLIGHSGCGKSTVLSVLAGFVKATQGSAVVNGKKVTKPDTDRGIVFQNYSLLPWLTVSQNVFEAVDSVFPQKTLEEKKNITDQYLGMVNLTAHRDKKPAQISGGMKQRVAIARAFAINPAVLLLDEPFGALDALTKASLHEELLSLWRQEEEKKTIVMVSHDIEEVIYLSDRVIVMTNGPAATISEIVDVPLPRPRTKATVNHHPNYTPVRDKLLYLLMEKHAHH